MALDKQIELVLKGLLSESDEFHDYGEVHISGGTTSKLQKVSINLYDVNQTITLQGIHQFLDSVRDAFGRDELERKEVELMPCPSHMIATQAEESGHKWHELAMDMEMNRRIPTPLKPRYWVEMKLAWKLDSD